MAVCLLLVYLLLVHLLLVYLLQSAIASTPKREKKGDDRDSWEFRSQSPSALTARDSGVHFEINIEMRPRDTCECFLILLDKKHIFIPILNMLR